MIKTRKRQRVKDELNGELNSDIENEKIDNKKLKIENEETKQKVKKQLKNKEEKQHQFNEESKIQHVIRLSNVPYGFFEKEMNGYFSQFGDVKRVRVIRSKKGHHTGFAYVEFKNEKVAEIAAKSMNNYLLAEKKLRCSVVDQDKIPKCIRGGKRFGNIIEPGENRKEKIKEFFCLQNIPFLI
ncbi:unnamed protein product [Meloidogyne enterolobii]|uniref:Uncharacterized protein n=1 Tax=Meloidogyne enterolobii TaxID=390850 RepID=A0ACB0YSZ0_MELEN